MSTREEMIAHNRTVEEVAAELGCDSLHYLSLEGMVKATGFPKEKFCMACYTGNYPVAYDPGVDKHVIERRNGRVMGLSESIAAERAQITLI
jgi:amidophosphoribosyltransferase